MVMVMYYKKIMFIIIVLFLFSVYIHSFNFNAHISYKSNIKITNNTCNTDSDCLIQGCNNEICAPKWRKIYSPCVWKSEYENLHKYYKCRCLNGKCQWIKKSNFSLQLNNSNNNSFINSSIYSLCNKYNGFNKIMKKFGYDCAFRSIIEESCFMDCMKSFNITMYLSLNITNIKYCISKCETTKCICLSHFKFVNVVPPLVYSSLNKTNTKTVFVNVFSNLINNFVMNVFTTSFKLKIKKTNNILSIKNN